MIMHNITSCYEFFFAFFKKVGKRLLSRRESVVTEDEEFSQQVYIQITPATFISKYYILSDITFHNLL